MRPQVLESFVEDFGGETVDEALEWLNDYFNGQVWSLEREEWFLMEEAEQVALAEKFLDVINGTHHK